MSGLPAGVFGSGSEMRPRKAWTADRSTSITSFATSPCASSCTRFGGLDVGRLNEAEAGAAGLVEPIGQEPDAVSFLNLQILAVSLGDIGRAEAREVVSVEEYGTQAPVEGDWAS